MAMIFQAVRLFRLIARVARITSAVFIWMIPEGWLFRLREIRLLSANGWKRVGNG